MNLAIYDSDGRITSVKSGPMASLQLAIERGAVGLLHEEKIDPSIHYVKDGELVFYPEKPSDDYVFNYALEVWEPDLAMAKSRKWEKIKAAREDQEFGSFDWNGYIFQCDEVSQRRIQGAVQLAMINMQFSIDWTLLDNTVITLTAQEMIEVGQYLAAHVNACHVKSRQLRVQIDAAESLDAVNLIEW